MSSNETQQQVFFIHRPKGIFAYPKNEILSVGSELPVGTYQVHVTPDGEFYLSPVDRFPVREKIYGSTEKLVNRILTTYNDRNDSTGVLLSGEQGSGKTLTSHLLSQQCADQGISTIIVSNAFTGNSFNSFMQRLSRCVVIFDEFEKVYDDDEQEQLLTLFDGMYNSCGSAKKLYVFTCNRAILIDQHMLNRPGRIMYHIKFKGLEKSFVEGYCADNLKRIELIPNILRIGEQLSSFNFDVLRSIVEELNRFGDMSLDEAISILNLAVRQNVDDHYQISIWVDGEQLKHGFDRFRYFDMSSNHPILISYSDELEDLSMKDHGTHDIKRRLFVFEPSHIRQFTATSAEYVNGSVRAVFTLTSSMKQEYQIKTGL